MQICKLPLHSSMAGSDLWEPVRCSRRFVCHPSLLPPSKQERAALEQADLWCNSLFFPESGALDWKPRKATATLAFCQLSLQLWQGCCSAPGISEKSMLPWEQAPKQVAITHTLTWTRAGGRTSPSDPLMGEEISSRFVCAQSAAVRRMVPK